MVLYEGRSSTGFDDCASSLRVLSKGYWMFL